MVTRRQSLKAIASSLLVPVLDSSILAALGTAAQSARATDPACASCATTESLRKLYANVLDSAAHLKHVAIPRSLLPMRRSTRAGIALQYVESATGNLTFGVEDLRLRGLPGLGFKRYYNGASSTDGALGKGWSFAFEDRVSVDGSTATLTTAAGDTVAMTANADGSGYTAQKAGLNPHAALLRIDAHTLREVLTPTMTRTYTLAGANKATYLLSSFEYGKAGSIAIVRDSAGRIQSIASSIGGRRIDFTWSQGAPSRLVGLADSAGRTLRYVYTGSLLTGVVDVAGAQWRYAYDGDRLSAIVDPEGTTVLGVGYANGRVASTSTVAGTLRYTYAGGGNVNVSDGGGRAVALSHNGDGQLQAAAFAGAGGAVSIAYTGDARVASVTSADGVHQYAYDAAGRPTLSAKGKKWKQWQYDGSGRIHSVTDAAGPVTYVYDDVAGTVQAQSARKARAYTATYGNGRLTALKSAKRTHTFAHTPGGQLASVTSGKNLEVSYEYDDAGFLLAEQFGSGYRASCVRNARGELTQWADSTGRQFSFQRDARGAIVQITNAKGAWARAQRDASGRIVSLSNSNAQVRRFSYDSGGALARYTDALGREYAVEYDAISGRATQMTQTNGSSTIVRSASGDALFVAGAQTGTSTGSASVSASIDDGWMDPLGGEGLIGSFSGFSAYAATHIASTPGSEVPVALVSMLVMAGDSDGDDDDGDDDDGDDDDGDDDDDDDDDDDNPDCAPCEATYTQTCDASQEDAYSSAQWIEIGADALCAATIETGPGILLCLAAAEAAYQAMVHTADTNHSNCISLIPQNCYSQCQ